MKLWSECYILYKNCNHFGLQHNEPYYRWLWWSPDFLNLPVFKPWSVPVGTVKMSDCDVVMTLEHMCLFIKSLFYHSCFRSYENDNKLERNIEFLAEALARHIFNLTTKVSLLCLKWIKSDYCLLLFTLAATYSCKIHCSFLHESHSVWKHGSSSEPRGERRLTALSKATLADLLLWVEENFATIQLVWPYFLRTDFFHLASRYEVRSPLSWIYLF